MSEAMADNNEYFQEENEIENTDKNNEEEIKLTERSNDTKNIILYRNGDKFFPPKRFVVNKRYIRTWDAFLEELTKSIQPRSGAIRDIRTPFHGTRIRSLDDLTLNGKYVAVPKGEAMKLIDYTNVIDVTSPVQQSKRDSQRLKPLKALINHDMNKVESKINQQLYSKCIVINVYRNGDPFTRAIKVVLNQFEQKHMSILVRAIEERVLLPSNRPIRRLYTMTGNIIRFAKDVEDGQYYVAAANEPLYDIKYGQYLPVIRGGKIHSSHNKVKYLNNTSSLITHRNNGEGNVSNEVINRSERAGYNSDRKQKPTTNKQQKKTVSKEHTEIENATIKIQAAFRGYAVRNEIRNAQENNTVILKTKYKYEPNQESQGRKDKYPKQKLYERPNKRKEDNQKQKENNQKQKADIQKQKDDNQKQKENDYKKKEIQKQKDDNQRQKENTQKQKEQNHPKNKPHDNNNKNLSNNKEQEKQEERKKTMNQSHSVKEHSAATKIQAGFRGYLVRKQLFSNTFDTKQNINNNKIYDNKKKFEKKENANNQEKKEITHEKQNKVNKNGETNDKIKSSIKIQSGFRAYKARKILNENPDIQKENGAIKIQYGYKGYKIREQIYDNEIKENAATKIQSSFKAYERRKYLNNNLHEKSAEEQSMERNKAVLTIQAGFRGFKVRRELER